MYGFTTVTVRPMVHPRPKSSRRMAHDASRHTPTLASGMEIRDGTVDARWIPVFTRGFSAGGEFHEGFTWGFSESRGGCVV